MISLGGNKCLYYTGIASSYSGLPAYQNKEFITASYNAGACGYVIFSGAQIVGHSDVQDVLASGVNNKWAILPHADIDKILEASFGDILDKVQRIYIPAGQMDSEQGTILVALFEEIIKMPFDNQIASASIDKTIKIWSTVSPYKCLMTLTNHKSPVTNIGIMNNNKKLVSLALDGSVIIFDLPKYKASKTVSIEASVRNMVPVTPLHFAIDNGNILKLYDITNFSKLFILLGHSDDITSITRLNNGKVATGSKDKTIRIWDISSQEVEKTLIGSNDRVNKLIQFKDGTLFSVCGNGSINMWDVESGTKLLVLNKNRLPMLTFMQLSDEIIISSTKERMYIWNVITGKCNNSIYYNFKLFC
jgi:WD40 repeat protein